PLAAGREELAGRHANTEIAKVVGAVPGYEATGDRRYLDIADTFWTTVVGRTGRSSWRASTVTSRRTSCRRSGPALFAPSPAARRRSARSLVASGCPASLVFDLGYSATTRAPTSSSRPPRAPDAPGLP
ncbi:beta-L-arabinofuranosidase domain-containing protein, partial [Streptomyces asiaticus]